MLLSSLNILHVRNLCTVSLDCDSAANAFYGDNGSGKTSFLEAIYILGRGRSFRNRDSKLIVKTGENELLVSGTVMTDKSVAAGRLGVKRTVKGKFEARHNGANVRSASQLAARLPLQLVDAHSFLLLEGGPVKRRQFVDWGVFHVEHSYFGIWRRMQRALKQRNELLRHERPDGEELSVWTKEFISSSEAIVTFRDRYLAELEKELAIISGHFDGLGCLSLEHYKGWGRNNDLSDVLAADRNRDLSAGKTHHGAHRADLIVRINEALATERLSRGQLKRLVYILKLAQASLYKKKTAESCVFLLDDLPAELDFRHRRQVIECLNELSCQYFMTGVDKNDFDGLLKEKAHHVFHVEQGKISMEC